MNNKLYFVNVFRILGESEIFGPYQTFEQGVKCINSYISKKYTKEQIDFCAEWLASRPEKGEFRSHTEVIEVYASEQEKGI